MEADNKQPEWEEINLDLLNNLQASEKPFLEKRTACIIKGTPKVAFDKNQVKKKDKNGAEYSELKLTFNFEFPEPINNRKEATQVFMIHVYDGTIINWGSAKSSSGQLINLIVDSIPGIKKTSPLSEILRAVADKKCQVISRETTYNEIKSNRYDIVTFL